MNRIEAMVEASKRMKIVVPQEKRCPTCGVVKALVDYPKGGGLDGHGNECSGCNGKRANEWYAAQPLERRRAKHDVANDVRFGKRPVVSTQVCERCGEAAKHYHHPDYSQSREVVPLCRACHVKLHKSERKAG